MATASASDNMIGSTANDPVAKAVMDNILGCLPTKKPLVRCNDCDLCFTSQTVLDAHLQGSRHAKQIRSKVIMATLEETKVAFTKDHEANGGLKCNVCNVCLNSIQQLQTHLNGNRHKKKITKGGWTGPEITSQIRSLASPGSAASGNKSQSNQTKLGTNLSCDTCNKYFNSKAQYDVHISSKKHSQKLCPSVLKTKKKRFSPYRKKMHPEYGQDNLKVPALSSNFISGGFVNN